MHSEQNRKCALIRQLVRARRGDELRLMTLGVSKYCRPENDKKVSFAPVNRETALHPASLAYFHLEFTARHGPDALQAEEGGKWEFAYPEEFEVWLGQGAPGLFLEELEAYVAENPIET